MKNYWKLLITMLSTGAIVGCSHQNNVDKTNTTTTEGGTTTEEETGSSGGQGVTPNSGGWPILDKLPISGSLGPSKSNFFSDRIMESRFNTWKAKKDAFAKALYAASDHYESDLKLYYKGSKDDWFSSAVSTPAYNTWRNGAGKAALSTLWRATTDYTTKRNNWVAGGVSTKRNKATWLGLAASNTPYNTWRVKRKTPLKNAWEATSRGATSFTTKLAAYQTAHTTDTKEKYADLAASNANYNTWRLTRTNPLKTAWEATGVARGQYLNLVNAWFTSDRAALDTKAEWIANAASNTAFNAWKTSDANRDADQKAIWENTANYLTAAKNAVNVRSYATGDTANFKSFYKGNLNNRVQMNRNFSATITSGRAGPDRTLGDGVNQNSLESLLYFLARSIDNRLHDYAGIFSDYTARPKAARYLTAWDNILAASDTKAAVLTDLITVYEEIHAKKLDAILDNNYNNYAKAQFKTATHTVAYNAAFTAWNTDTNLRAYWANLPASTTAYTNYKKTTYKATVTSAVYNTGLDAWSTTKANGVATYKTSAALTNDYATWINAQYKAATATYNRDLDAWSATKANGVSLYNADAESTTDYNSWQDPNQRTAAKYDNNHLGQFNTDLGLWTANKTNGKTTYFAAAASNTAFSAWNNPSPNDLSTYNGSITYNTNFDNFVANHLTWATYSKFFKNQEYNSDSFKTIYRKYLLDE